MANVGDSRAVICRGGNGKNWRPFFHLLLNIFVGCELFYSNVMVVLCCAAFAVSRDHKPDQTDERQRIEEAGGFVMWAGNSYGFFNLVLVY